jgi:hypothetical protein
MFTNSDKVEEADRKMRGQSLTEFAITLPVLLLIIVGVVEVANLLGTYNRLQLSVREGARFGGAGGTNEGIEEVVINSGQYALEAGFEDVYVVRPTVDGNGTSWGGTWEPEDEIHVYGTGPETSGIDPASVLADLQSGASSNSNLANLEVVVVVGRYQADTILGFPMFEGLEGRIPIQVYGLMPLQADVQATERLTAGCSFFPIAINREDAEYSMGHSFEDAVAGDIIDLPLGDNSSAWDFVICNTGPGWSDWAHSMNSSCGGPTGFEYQNPLDPEDHQLHVGDWVYGLTAGHYPSGIGNALLEHCKTTGGGGSCIGMAGDPRAIRVLIYDQVAMDDATGHYIYHVDGFFIMRILDFNVTGQPPYFITARFERLDDGCGNPLP